MFFTRVLRNSAINSTAKQIAGRNSSLGDSFAFNEVRRLGFGVAEWAIGLSLILAWPVAVSEYSEHRKWLRTSEEFN